MRKTDASSPSGGVKFATGQYTGDGNATQAIIGVGFQPKFLMIGAGVFADVNTHALKSDVDGLNTSVPQLGVGNVVYALDQVISLDADGFTVGDGTGLANILNVLGRLYSFMCWG